MIFRFAAFFFLSTLLCLNTALQSQTPLIETDDAWTNLELCEQVNGSEAEAYPWLSADALRVYFAQGKRGVNSTACDLFMASRASIDDAFGKPELVLLPHSDFGILSVWLSSDERTIYYGAKNSLSHATIYMATRADVRRPFVDAGVITLLDCPNGFLAAPSLSQDRSELYLYLSHSSQKREILMFSRVDPSTYQYSHSLEFPEHILPGPGQLSKNDTRYYLGASDTVTQYKELYYLQRTHRGHPFTELKRVGPGTEHHSLHLTQPSLAADDRAMVFIQSDGNWYDNDLGSAQSKKDIERLPDALTPAAYSPVGIYPNPVADKLFFEVDMPDGETTITIELADMHGAVIRSAQIDCSVDRPAMLLHDLAAGNYVCRVMVSGRAPEFCRFTKM